MTCCRGEPPPSPAPPHPPLRHPITMFCPLGFQLTPHLLEEPVITKDIYEVAVSLILMFDDLDMKESG